MCPLLLFISHPPKRSICNVIKNVEVYMYIKIYIYYNVYFIVDISPNKRSLTFSSVLDWQWWNIYSCRDWRLRSKGAGVEALLGVGAMGLLNIPSSWVWTMRAAPGFSSEYPKGLKSRVSRRYLYSCVHGNIIHHIKRVETTQVSIQGWIHKKKIWYIHTLEYSTFKRRVWCVLPH